MNTSASPANSPLRRRRTPRPMNHRRRLVSLWLALGILPTLVTGLSIF